MATDADLLRAARTEAAPFRTLYDRYADRIYRFHLSRTRSTEAAHDLTAETFARAWVGRHRFRDEAAGSAAPWLLGIAHYVLIASVRKGRMERRACERLGLLEAVDRPRVEVEPAESWVEGLDDALADLPAGQVAAIRLRVIHELSYDDVADALGTSPASARVRVHRGLSALRARLTSPKEATR